MMLVAETHDTGPEAACREAAERAGVAEPPGCLIQPPGVPLTVFAATDPDRAWAELGCYLLGAAAAYRRWHAGRPATASVSTATSVAGLRAEQGPYQIITPAEASGYTARGIPLALQPLLGDVAWRYLEIAASAGVAG